MVGEKDTCYFLIAGQNLCVCKLQEESLIASFNKPSGKK